MPYPKLEYKYLLPIAHADALRDVLLRHMHADPFAERSPRREYVVRSVYLDSPRLSAYREKIEGVRHRRKYRIRAYGEADGSSKAFFEIKEKQGVYLTKYRSVLSVADIEQCVRDRDISRHVFDERGDGIHPANAEKFFLDYDRKALRPVVLVVYEREAYTVNGPGDLRVTIDKHLRSARVEAHDALRRDDALLPVMRQHFVLEVKFTRGVPAWLRSQLAQYHLRRLAISKYTLGMDVHA